MAVACLREAFNFTAANEDHNLYSFDMRKLDKALCVHKDHVSAVMDIDYSPTGKEFVTGSYDRTVRIFGNTAGHSREVHPLPSASLSPVPFSHWDCADMAWIGERCIIPNACNASLTSASAKTASSSFRRATT